MEHAPKLTLAAVLLLLAATAVAQQTGRDHAMMNNTSPADQAFMSSMMKMHEAMNVRLSGDPDRDFVMMMIPHHQGAIDMAKVELQYGKDPTIRKLAKAVVAAQENEVAEMQRWLARPGR